MENPGEKKFLEELEKSKFRIAEAGSVRNPALFVLRKNGCRLGAYDSSTETWDQITYYAVKDERMFIAYDPLTLLGIVALWENLGDDWQKLPKGNIKDELLSEIFPEDE